MNNLNLKRIAVGYAHSGKNIGGVRRYLENIEKLSKHTISLYPSYENDSLWREKYDMKIRNNYRNNEIKAKQQEIIDNHDVFHSNVDPTWIKLCEEAQKQGKLWIHTYHSIYTENGYGKLMDWQNEINEVQFNIASKAKYKICVGEWLVDECNQRNIDAVFLPNFINLSKLNAINRGAFKKRNNIEDFILFSGDVSINKNCVEFIKTAKLLPQYKFVLMGTGLTKEDIVKTHTIELTDNVIAMGPLSHTECLEAMNDCSILVMNSFTEGLPTVLIEAMYYETPCIIPDGPDWSKYLLEDTDIGYKYPLGNVEKLSEKLSEIMKDYKTLPNAKKYVESTFSSNAVISKLDELYSKTINITILTDCHGDNIKYYLKKMLDNSKYNITFVSLVPYVELNANFTDYDVKDKNIISNADILIYQIIEKDRKFLNNDNTLNLCKRGCIKIGIPHYRCNIYISPEYWDPLLSDIHTNQFNQKIIYDNPVEIVKKLIVEYSKTDVNRFKINIENSLSKFQQIDNFSDIKMFNYFVNNYKNIKLFMGNSYPSSIFFFELTKRIVNYLNIKCTFKYEDRSIYTNTNVPVPVTYYKFADFKFENDKFIVHNEYITETEFWTNLLIMRSSKHWSHNSELFLEKLKETKHLLMGKKNLLISSLDNKFFIEIVEQLKQDYNVKIDLFHENNDETREELLNWADIIFCEWCEVNALWYSKNKKSHQKLFIRLHKYELFTSFFYDINWKSVDNLIFIAPEMKRLANKHLLQKKYLNENNFDWEFYLKNNNDLFEDINKKDYNKIWAWNHWINYGNKMDWRRPVIKLTDDIDYTVICDEFKHFNGGELIWNYVKTDMFSDLPKLEGSEFNIGMVGILPKWKRPDIALDIIENLIKKDKRYKLFILGKWYTEWCGTSKNKKEIEYYKNLEERINNSELKNHVVFDKFTPEVHKWFQKIGFILSVSDIEGSHQSVAEAMATGTIPLIYGKALKEYKLDEVYPKKYCFYEDNVDKLCDKIYFYSNNVNCSSPNKLDKLVDIICYRPDEFLISKTVISIECRRYSEKNFNLKNIYDDIKNVILSNKILKKDFNYRRN